jgi:hypothetical protein
MFWTLLLKVRLIILEIWYHPVELLLHVFDHYLCAIVMSMLHLCIQFELTQCKLHRFLDFLRHLILRLFIPSPMIFLYSINARQSGCSNSLHLSMISLRTWMWSKVLKLLLKHVCSFACIMSKTHSTLFGSILLFSSAVFEWLLRDASTRPQVADSETSFGYETPRRIG